MGYIEAGKSEGATVALGGKAHDAPGGGYFIEPTIFTNVNPNMKIVREEIFGPVVTVTSFSDEEDVIRQANDTTYGLAAGIFTKDYERAVRVTDALKAGTTWVGCSISHYVSLNGVSSHLNPTNTMKVNMYNLVHWSLPFGGYKESGIGRECGEAGLENYLETKTCYWNMGIQSPR